MNRYEVYPLINFEAESDDEARERLKAMEAALNGVHPSCDAVLDDEWYRVDGQTSDSDGQPVRL